MRCIYTGLFWLMLPFIVLRLYWKSLKNPAYRQRIAERFGFLPQATATPSIWVHAVSVGEVIAAIPLIKQLLQRYPNLPVIVTTMTPTGAERVATTFGSKVTHYYVPYDLPSMIRRFIQKTHPIILLLIETELWPNLVSVCKQAKIPTLLLNARLSAKSAAGYARCSSLTRKLLKQLTLVGAQNSEDGARFVALGLPPAQLQITGSIKFDLEIPADLSQRAQALRQSWNAARPVWIAASTHAGEDEQILAAFATLRLQLPTLVLILVPRHPERFAKVAALCQQYSQQVVRRSEQRVGNDTTEIFIGDTMGELLLFYACADLAFVGGSLVNTGGHNPLEPAALGLPILTGPHLFNFEVIGRQLKAAGALIEINDAAELAAQVSEILQDNIKYSQMRAAGLQVMTQNRGALVQQLALVEKFLS